MEERQDKGDISVKKRSVKFGRHSQTDCFAPSAYLILKTEATSEREQLC